MKLNLHVPFKAWNGEEIKERKGMKRFVLGIVVICWITIDAEMVAKQKLASYELYCKISKAKGVVELTAEEAALVKQAAAVLNPGGYGQIVELIEKK